MGARGGGATGRGSGRAVKSGVSGRSSRRRVLRTGESLRRAGEAAGGEIVAGDSVRGGCCRGRGGSLVVVDSQERSCGTTRGRRGELDAGPTRPRRGPAVRRGGLVGRGAAVWSSADSRLDLPVAAIVQFLKSKKPSRSDGVLDGERRYLQSREYRPSEDDGARRSARFVDPSPPPPAKFAAARGPSAPPPLPSRGEQHDRHLVQHLVESAEGDKGPSQPSSRSPLAHAPEWIGSLCPFLRFGGS